MSLLFNYVYHSLLSQVLGQPEHALLAYSQALELNPSFHVARLNIAKLLDALGDPSMATEHVRYPMLNDDYDDIV